MENRGGMAFPELHSCSAGRNKNMNQTSICLRLELLDFLYILDLPDEHSDQRPFQWDCHWMILFNVKISWADMNHF